MIFSLSSALAPVLGGWVVKLFAWRAIFLTLFAYAVALLMHCWHSLPETLPQQCTAPDWNRHHGAEICYDLRQSPLPSCCSCHGM